MQPSSLQQNVMFMCLPRSQSKFGTSKIISIQFGSLQCKQISYQKFLHHSVIYNKKKKYHHSKCQKIKVTLVNRIQFYVRFHSEKVTDIPQGWELSLCWRLGCLLLISIIAQILRIRCQRLCLWRCKYRCRPLRSLRENCPSTLKQCMIGLRECKRKSPHYDYQG